MPLFYWLLDVALVNSYLLFFWATGHFNSKGNPSTSSHKKFRLDVINSLLEASKPVIDVIYVQKGDVLAHGRRILPTKQHTRRPSGTRRSCYYCRMIYKLAKRDGTTPPLIGRTYSYCRQCEYPIYKPPAKCWERFHELEVVEDDDERDRLSDLEH